MAKPAPSSTLEGVIASSIELVPANQGAVATNVLLLPFGESWGRDGRGPFVLEDSAHAAQVIAVTRKVQGKADIPFDYDHQSFHAQRVGGQAKAAGWIKPTSLTVADDGIRGDVQWTAPAEAALQAREYRYHSPYFMVDKATRRITRLVNAGLTNTPNLELPALASQEPGQTTEEGTDMSKPVLAAALSSTALTAMQLTAESSDEDVTAAIDQLVTDKAGADKVLASVRTKLGVADDAGEEAVLASIGTAGGEPDPTKYVPVAALKDVTDQLAEIRQEKILATVEQAIEAGKLPPAQKDWAIKHGQADFASLQSFLGTQPAFKGGAQIQGDPPVGGNGKLTAEEAAICSQLGITEEAFLKSKKEEEAA